MPAKLIHAVVLLQMLAHSIFGCCWHHSHAEGQTGCQHATVAHAHEAANSCGHHSHEHPADRASNSTPDSGQSPHRNQPCDEERCQYLVTESTQISDSERPFQMIAFDCVDAHLAVSGCGSVHGIDRFRERPSSSLSAVQRCALLQTWLI
jgi:hypothetical protein